MRTKYKKVLLKECRKILGQYEQDITDEKIEQIMDFMWNEAEIEFNQFINTQNHE